MSRDLTGWRTGHLLPVPGPVIWKDALKWDFFVHEGPINRSAVPDLVGVMLKLSSKQRPALAH